jgi:hypothetical protein
VRLDQPANGGVWVQNPLHRANKKTEASCLGFFVDMAFETRRPVQTARTQRKRCSVATNGSGVRLDQPANGGVWVQRVGSIQSHDSLTSHRVIRQKKFFPYHLCILDIYKSHDL